MKEAFFAKNSLSEGSVWDVAFSRDAAQTYIFLADGRNMKIRVLRRDTLEELTSFGDGGRQPGQFYGVHSIATDSKGNLYTTETYEGKRVQKFVVQGTQALYEAGAGDGVASMSMRTKTTLGFLVVCRADWWRVHGAAVSQPRTHSLGSRRRPPTASGAPTAPTWPAPATRRSTRSTPRNFGTLEVAWRFKTDNLGPRPEFNFQSTPLMVGGVLYTTAGSRRAVVALDAATGEMLWMHREDEGKRGRGSAAAAVGPRARLLVRRPHRRASSTSRPATG